MTDKATVLAAMICLAGGNFNFPVIRSKSDYRCVQCHKDIPPGKAGRRCVECREKDKPVSVIS